MADTGVLDRRRTATPGSRRRRGLAAWLAPVAAKPAASSAGVPAKRHLPLLDLLAWTYRDQLAQRYLRREIDWFIQVIGEDRLLGDDAARAKVHPDAAQVHAAVMRAVREARRDLRARRGAGGRVLDPIRERLAEAEQKAGLVIHFAELGERPERSRFDDRPLGWGCDPETADLPATGLPPLPYPVEPLNLQFSSYGWAEIAGRRVCYAKLTDDQVMVDAEEWSTGGRGKERGGRGRVTHAVRQVKVPVEYCPIDWRPGSELVAMTNHIAAAWEAAIAALATELAGAEFRAHVLTSEERQAA